MKSHRKPRKNAQRRPPEIGNRLARLIALGVFGFFMLWVVVLAIALVRRQEDTASQTVSGGIVLTPTTNH